MLKIQFFEKGVSKPLRPWSMPLKLFTYSTAPSFERQYCNMSIVNDVMMWQHEEKNERIGPMPKNQKKRNCEI